MSQSRTLFAAGRWPDRAERLAMSAQIEAAATLPNNAQNELAAMYRTTSRLMAMVDQTQISHKTACEFVSGAVRQFEDAYRGIAKGMAA